MEQQPKTVIVIAGPTAVGKTAVAISVARLFGTAVISADSRQCFRELNIGVARPSVDELAAVPHYFIASHSIREEVTAAAFESYALDKTGALFRHNDVVVMAGGTGLYIKAFCEGLDAIPAVGEEIRSRIQEQYSAHGISWLQQQLQVKDPAFYQTGEMKNPQRMMRALEVVEATGASILSFRSASPAMRGFNIIKIGLELPRDLLYQRINARVDQMIGAGLVDEAKQLIPFRHYNALQTVGYSELFDHFDGAISLDEAVDRIKKHTRHYAKRQMTWFKKDLSFRWFVPTAVNDMVSFIQNAMAHNTSQAQ